MTYSASPATRAFAARQGVDLDAVARETGRHSLAREDIERHLGKAGPNADNMREDVTRYWDVDHAEYGPIREEPLSRVDLVAIANLTAANAAIPQVTHHDRADVRAIETFRARMKPQADERGLRLSALAFHVMALARCLVEHPKVNASLSPGADRLILKDYVHIAIAIDTPHGLVVPVIRDADRKGLWQIAGEISDLAERAQSRKLRPDEMGGASMTISNLGGIGGIGFTPLVNPPEVAILGLSRTQTVPVWQDDGWMPVPMVPLDLSYDHRVVNGADAARFLVRHAQLIGDPRLLVAG